MNKRLRTEACLAAIPYLMLAGFSQSESHRDRPLGPTLKRAKGPVPLALTIFEQIDFYVFVLILARPMYMVLTYHKGYQFPFYLDALGYLSFHTS
ncbi:MULTISPECIES: hypothetical protein [Bacillus]|uniref:Uncharacterized protein n=1 Tax=Bacillus infantis NRRL B-14911 TaxID=1367477 RepID=U5L833_9BACI|nr:MULTISPECIES: hypothetical protein [Bacillus]AGX02782.1 hypothetical protein N288_04125 [Bacillus infantis NRRL B-14911]